MKNIVDKKQKQKPKNPESQDQNTYSCDNSSTTK